MSENDASILSTLNTTITSSPNANQREIATAIGMSLGMTNTILKRFAEKGWIYMQKINAKNIKYVLTAEGRSELAKRSNGFIKRTLSEVYNYKEKFLKFFAEEKNNGIEKVVLVGKDDVEFIIEYSCSKCSLKFETCNETRELIVSQADTLFLISDNTEIDESSVTQNGGKVVKVMDLLMD